MDPWHTIYSSTMDPSWVITPKPSDLLSRNACISKTATSPRFAVASPEFSRRHTGKRNGSAAGILRSLLEDLEYLCDGLSVVVLFLC